MQTELIVDAPMARKKMGRPPTSDRDDTVVRLDRRVAAKAKYVASTRNIPIAEYLTELIRALVDRDFDRAVKANGGTK